MYTNINTKNLYFLSPDKNLTILFPRIPKSREKCENDNIKRICFSNSIEGCLLAITQHYLKNKLYIYKVKHVLKDYNTSKPKLKKRSIGISNINLVKNRLVDDAYLTNEIWLLEPVILYLVGEY